MCCCQNSGAIEEAADTFRKAQARDPQNFTALLGLGTSLATLHQYVEAANYLQQASDLRPQDFQAGYQWAFALREAKRPSAAKGVLNRLSAPQGPELATKYYSLAGVIAEDLGEFPTAARCYRRAYETDPNSYEIYVALVRTNMSVGSIRFRRELAGTTGESVSRPELSSRTAICVDGRLPRGRSPIRGSFAAGPFERGRRAEPRTGL